MIHPASLVDNSHHSKALLRLLEAAPDTPRVINPIVLIVQDLVEFALARSGLTDEGVQPREELLSAFKVLVERVLSTAQVTTPVVLVALVYIKRARPCIQIVLREWALERVFLGLLILASKHDERVSEQTLIKSKYLNDSCIINADWSCCTGVFGNRDIIWIEREFLEVLDWELKVTEHDLVESLTVLQREEISEEATSRESPQKRRQGVQRKRRGRRRTRRRYRYLDS
ncbi:hypothetical protein PM082_000054 [Marasmius tenuissimus]|nr:hypothetical protein PM082_000054 [Marasmius tenuissimus]